MEGKTAPETHAKRRPYKANPDAVKALKEDPLFDRLMDVILMDFHNLESRGSGVCGTGGKYCMADASQVIEAHPKNPKEIRDLIQGELDELQAVWKDRMDQLATKVQKMTGADHELTPSWVLDEHGLSLVMSHRHDG